jgi:parallel beta-helix repeat protein
MGVAGYLIFRDASQIDNVSDTTFSDTALRSGTEYSYTVQAYDAAGNISAHSANASATTQGAADTEAPTVPTGLAATAVSSSQIDLTWNASTDNVGVVGYRIFRNGTLSDSTSGTSHSDTGLSPSTTYTYSVRAYDAAGNTSGASASASATTRGAADTEAPTVPTGLAATAVSSSQIDLTWNASTDNVGVVGYRIFRNGTLSDSTSGTSHSDTGLSPSTTYTYTVQAYDAAGNISAHSASANATTQGASASCSSATTLCVDDTAGATQEYATIAAAASDAGPGDTVLVHDGSYRGLTISRSGTSGTHIVFLANGSNVVIASPGPTGDGIRLQDVDYITIEGFTIQDPDIRCIAARGASPTSPMRGNVIRGNTCTDAGREGFYLSQYGNGLVENNTITRTGVRNQDKSHGMYLANAGSDNTIIRGNTIYQVSGSDAQGIHVNGDLGVGGDGIVSGILIEKNLIHDTPYNGLNFDGVQNSTVQNNILYNNGRHAIRAYAIDGAEGPKDLKIINNTLISGTGSGWAMKCSNDEGGHTFFNNVLLGSSGSLVVGMSNFESDNNVVTNSFSLNEESSTISLSAWRSAGHGINSVTATASDLFVNSGSHNYHLKAGSPAIDAGRASLNSILAPTADFLGAFRPVGSGFDIGAYEHRD